MEYELILSLRILVAAILGGIIGLERESLNKTAGFRTHTLVCLGSCLIMILSIEMFEVYGRGEIGDPARLAAQVVSGIGFLGAGAIMRSGFGVRGLTTAATLWVVAGIGLAVGAGKFILAVGTTVIVFIVLTYLTFFEKALSTSQKKDKRIEAIITDKPGQLGLVCTALGEMDILIKNVEMHEDKGDNTIKIGFSVNIPYAVDKELIIQKLSGVSGVHEIKMI